MSNFFVPIFSIIIGICIGVTVYYLITPPPQVIMKIPNPNNLSTVYKDDNDVCYQYKMKETPCDPIYEDEEIVF